MKQVVRNVESPTVNISDVDPKKCYVLEAKGSFGIIHAENIESRIRAYCVSDDFTNGNNWDAGIDTADLQTFIAKLMDINHTWKIHEFNTAREMFAFLSNRI